MDSNQNINSGAMDNYSTLTMGKFIVAPYALSITAISSLCAIILAYLISEELENMGARRFAIKLGFFTPQKEIDRRDLIMYNQNNF